MEFVTSITQLSHAMVWVSLAVPFVACFVLAAIYAVAAR